MSQIELATKLEQVGIRLDSSAIARIENNAYADRPARVIRLGEAYAIAKILKTPFQDMFSDAESVAEMRLRAGREVERSVHVSINADISRADSIIQVLTFDSMLNEPGVDRNAINHYIGKLESVRNELETLYAKFKGPEHPKNRAERQEFYTHLEAVRKKLENIEITLTIDT